MFLFCFQGDVSLSRVKTRLLKHYILISNTVYYCIRKSKSNKVVFFPYDLYKSLFWLMDV